MAPISGFVEKKRRLRERGGGGELFQVSFKNWKINNLQVMRLGEGKMKHSIFYISHASEKVMSLKT